MVIDDDKMLVCVNIIIPRGACNAYIVNEGAKMIANYEDEVLRCLFDDKWAFNNPAWRSLDWVTHSTVGNSRWNYL